MLPSSLRALQNAASTCQSHFAASSAVSLRKTRSLSLQAPRTFQVRDSHRWTVSRTMRAAEPSAVDKDGGAVAEPRRTNEGTNVTLKDLPKGMRSMLCYKCMRQPIQIIIGKRGVDRGLLNCLQLHFRTHEVVKCRVARQWKDSVADLAQELEEKSGGVIVDRSGSRICLFRGYTHSDIPRREPNREEGWWSAYQKSPSEAASTTGKNWTDGEEESASSSEVPRRDPNSEDAWWSVYQESPSKAASLGKNRTEGEEDSPGSSDSDTKQLL